MDSVSLWAWPDPDGRVPSGTGREEGEREEGAPQVSTGFDAANNTRNAEACRLTRAHSRSHASQSSLSPAKRAALSKSSDATASSSTAAASPPCEAHAARSEANSARSAKFP